LLHHLPEKPMKRRWTSNLSVLKRQQRSNLAGTPLDTRIPLHPLLDHGLFTPI
jgi:hypothetical protein